MIRRRVPKPVSFRVTRKFWLLNWSPATTVTNDFWRYLTIRFADIPNSGEYGVMFDQYRINSVTWTFQPRYDGFAGNDTTDTTLPGVTNQGTTYAHVVIDPSSSQTPAGVYNATQLNTFLENGKVKTYNGTKPFKFTIKYPMISEDINGSTNSAYRRAKFISVNQNTIAHRGAHVFLQDVNLTGAFGQSFDVFVEVSLTLKGQR